jgi:hypothetical protein
LSIALTNELSRIWSALGHGRPEPWAPDPVHGRSMSLTSERGGRSDLAAACSDPAGQAAGVPDLGSERKSGAARGTAG